MTRPSATDEQLRPIIREAFAQIIDELPAPTRHVPGDDAASDYQARPPTRRADRVVVLAAAAAVVALVAGLVLVAQIRNGDATDSAASTVPASTGMDRRDGENPTPFADGVRMIVYVNANAIDESLQLIREELGKLSDFVPPDGIRYLGPEESLQQAQRLLADDPVTLELLTLGNVPTAFYLTPNEGVPYEDLAAAADFFRGLPEVARVDVDPTGGPAIPGIADVEPSTPPVTAPPTTAPSEADSKDQLITSPSLPTERVEYLAIGDSVMLGAAPELAARGYTVNATISRQMIDVTPWVDDLYEAGLIGTSVTVHLGNNGPITAETLDDFLAPLADADLVLILNVHADRPWATENNRLLAERDQRGDNIIVIDWDSIAQDCPIDCFAADGLHLTEQGRTFYADAIGDYTGK